MSGELAAVGYAEVGRAVAKKEDEPLDDIHSIEAVLFVIKDAEDQIGDLKNLKKKRARAIDRQIVAFDEKIVYLKKLIALTLEHHGKKRVRFPDVGSVSERKPRVSYTVKDQEKLFKVLRSEGEYDNIVGEEVAQTIKKHELNKLLALWSSLDKLPDCIDEKESENTVTVKFDDDIAVDVPDFDDELEF